MLNTDIMAPPNALCPVAETKFDREKNAFVRMKSRLLDQFRNRYVAIHDGKVVADGSELIDVAQRAYHEFGMVAIYVDLVADDLTRPIRMPSLRNVSNGRDS